MTPIIGPIVNAMSGNKSEMEASGPPIAVPGASGQKRSFISKMFRPKASNSKGKGLNNEMYDVGLYFSLRHLHPSLLIPSLSHTIPHGIPIALINYSRAVILGIIFTYAYRLI
jgi:hypothetical protein